MGKAVPNAVMDAMMDLVADTGDTLCVCSAEPSTDTEAYTTYMLARVTMTEGNGNGDYTVGQGDAGAGSYKLTVAEQASISITNSGNATHVAITDHAGTTLKLVTTCTLQALTAGGTVTVPTWDYELGIPA